jgi:hypothetical protein
MEKKMNFKTLDSLAPVALVIEEAGEAVKDKTRNIMNSPISDILIAVGGVGGGVVVDITVISLIAGKYISKLNWPQISHILKVIGRGSAKRGALFLAIPSVVLAAGGSVLAKSINRRQLAQAKERMLKEATAKLHAVLAAQREEIEIDRLRADELKNLCVLLTEYIKKLEEDIASGNKGGFAYA